MVTPAQRVRLPQHRAAPLSAPEDRHAQSGEQRLSGRSPEHIRLADRRHGHLKRELPHVLALSNRPPPALQLPALRPVGSRWLPEL